MSARDRRLGDPNSPSRRAETLLTELGRLDRRASVAFGLRFAREVLHIVPEHEQRPRRAVELAEAWLRGEATTNACRRAVSDRTDLILGLQVGDLDRDAVVCSAADAAYAAASVHQATGAWRAVYHVEGATFSGPCTMETVRAHKRAHYGRVLGLLQDIRIPLTAPTTTELHGAPEAVQVAWDAVCGLGGDLLFSELSAAHARADALGLDWRCRASRAVAERTEGREEGVAVLLGVRVALAA